MMWTWPSMNRVGVALPWACAFAPRPAASALPPNILRAVRRENTESDFAMLSSRLRDILRHDPIVASDRGARVRHASAGAERTLDDLARHAVAARAAGERHRRGERRCDLVRGVR